MHKRRHNTVMYFFPIIPNVGVSTHASFWFGKQTAYEQYAEPF